MYVCKHTCIGIFTHVHVYVYASVDVHAGCFLVELSIGHNEAGQPELASRSRGSAATLKGRRQPYPKGLEYTNDT